MRKPKISRWAFGCFRLTPRSGYVIKHNLIYVLLILVFLFAGICLQTCQARSETDDENDEADLRENILDGVFQGILYFTFPTGYYQMKEEIRQSAQESKEAFKESTEHQSDQQSDTKTREVFLSQQLQQQIDQGSKDISWEKSKTDILQQAHSKTELQKAVSFADRFSAMLSSAQKQILPEIGLWGDYDTMRRFYKAASNTSISPEELHFSEFILEDLRIGEAQTETKKQDYQILIYHTHSQEAFIDSPDALPEHSIIRVGEELTRQLEALGYRVLHIQDSFDLVDGKLHRSGAYGRAEPVITQILTEHPGIEVVLDIHRDGVGEQVHLATTIDDRTMATIMIFNGICRDTTGRLPDVNNPYEQTNLAFGYQLRLAMEAIAPGLCRTNYLKKGRYNLHMCPKSLLIEVGAQTNTMEEALASMKYLARSLHLVLGTFD